MSDDTLFERVKEEAHRPDPYPLFAALRECPVSRQRDGTYVAATHAAIASLLHDPRVSSETLPPADRPKTGNPFHDWLMKPVRDHITDTHRPFIFRDPPDHDTLRAAVMHQFTHRRVQAMRARSHVLVDEILTKLGDARTIDIVDDLAYPLPVTVICELLGVPPEDEERFHGWATQLATALEPDTLQDEDLRAENSRTFDAISEYMQGPDQGEAREPAGRHALRAGDGGCGRRAPHGRFRPDRHRDPHAGGGARDHRESHHQRYAHPAAPPRGVAPPARGPGAGAARGGGTVALRAPRAVPNAQDALPHPAGWVTIPEGAPLVLLLAAATATRRSIPIPTASIRTGPTTGISVSAVVCTTASARRSPGLRWRPPSSPWRVASGTRASSPIRRPTGRARPCAAPSTCVSPSTASIPDRHSEAGAPHPRANVGDTGQNPCTLRDLPCGQRNCR